MDTSEFEMTSRRGHLLRATLHRGAALCHRTLIVCHGMLSSRSSLKHVRICERAAETGTDALRFDFAGRGDSQGTVEDLSLSGEFADLLGVVDWVKKRCSGRVILLGSSLGGTVALMVAAEHSGIDRLVTIAAPAFLPQAPRETWGAAADEVPDIFFADGARQDVVAAAARVACPWLIIHSIDDPVVPVSDARAFEEACPHARLIERRAAGHRFADEQDLSWLLDRILEEGLNE